MVTRLLNSPNLSFLTSNKRITLSTSSGNEVEVKLDDAYECLDQCMLYRISCGLILFYLLFIPSIIDTRNMKPF